MRARRNRARISQEQSEILFVVYQARIPTPNSRVANLLHDCERESAALTLLVFGSSGRATITIPGSCPAGFRARRKREGALVVGEIPHPEMGARCSPSWSSTRRTSVF